jgi:hypothetical protein
MKELSSFLFPGSRIAVVGSRDFFEPSLVESFVSGLNDCIVVTGSDYEGFLNGRPVNSCGGIVDLTAAEACRNFGIELKEFSPQWSRYGRGAGKVRNGLIVKYGLSVMVAFVNDPEKISPGSSDVILKARNSGVPVFVFGPGG